jgi:hypothetical protein
LEQACDHSPAQLKLLSRCAARIIAEEGLLNLQTVHAAIAAAWAKAGRQGFERLQKTLSDQSRNG